MSGSTGNVVVVGSANVDQVVRVDRHPRPGETILGGDLRRHPGGKGANQAVAAAKAGGANTGFVGAFGRDEAGALLLDSLKSAGVDTSAMQRTDSPTGTALISVADTGENSIIVAPGANSHVQVDDAARQALQQADVVLAQLEIPIEVVLGAARARREGAQLILNAAPSRPLPLDLWDEIDLIVVNEHEAAGVLEASDGSTSDQLAQALLIRVPAAVITLGDRGSVLARRGESTSRLAAPKVDAVDTTGAGDTFCGVLAAALAQGESLLAAARLASAAGALAVTRHGAQEAVPTAEETRRLEEETYRNAD